MLNLMLDFNNALSDFLGSLPSGSIATQELDFACNDRPYHLTAVCQGKTYRLTLRDEWGKACPGFEVVCMGHRLAPEEGEDSIDLGERNRLDLASLNLYLEGQSLGRLQIVPEMPRMTAAEKEFALAQRHAWQFFYQMRTCPPLEVLKQKSEAAKRHLNACPSCRELMAVVEGDEAWADLARHLASSLPLPRIARGSSRARYGPFATIWRDGTAMVSTCVPPRSWSSPGAAASRSCPFVRKQILPVKGTFSSLTWGLLRRGTGLPFLGQASRECWGNVADARLQEVLEQTHQALPEAQTDLRHAFLNLERHVVDTFQKRALAWALSQTQKQEKGFVSRHWFNIMETLRDLFPVPSLDNMAVAADDSRTIPLQIIENNETKHHRASLTGWIKDEDGIHVSGKLLLPEDADPSVFVGWLERKGGEVVEAVRSELIDLYFYIDFPALEDVGENDLRLVAVRYGD